MSDLKISQLPELYYGEVQNGDYLPVVDISSGVTKKVRSDSFWMPVTDTVTAQAVIATNAKNDVLAMKTEIRNWYYGPLASDPLLRPDGTAVQVGDEYHSSVDHVRKVYSNGAWVDVSLAALAGAAGASKVGTSAISGISATNVQTVLAELASEKADLSVLANTGGAALVGIAPPSGMAATTVQAAIVELDTEKASLAALAATDGASKVGYDGQTVQDVLDAVTGPTGAASVGYTPAGTGAFDTTVEDQLRRESVHAVNHGADPTGALDSTAAIISALATGKDVKLTDGTYRLSPTAVQTIANQGYQRLYGEGSVTLIIDLASSIDLFVFNGPVALENLTIDFNNKYSKYAFKWNASAGHIRLKNIRLRNLKDTDSTTGSITFWITPTGNTFEIDGIKAYSMLKRGNGLITEAAGSYNMIYVGGGSGSTQGSIKNVFVNEIHNIDALDQIIYEDTAAIYIITDTSDALNRIEVSNIHGYNFGKRLLKIHASNVTVDNVTGYSTEGDSLGVIGFLSGEGLGDKYGNSASNVRAYGLMEFAFSASAFNVKLRNVIASVQPGNKAGMSNGAFGILVNGDGTDLDGFWSDSQRDIGIGSSNKVIKNTTLRNIHLVQNSIKSTGCSIHNTSATIGFDDLLIDGLTATVDSNATNTPVVYLVDYLNGTTKKGRNLSLKNVTVQSNGPLNSHLISTKYVENISIESCKYINTSGLSHFRLLSIENGSNVNIDDVVIEGTNQIGVFVKDCTGRNTIGRVYNPDASIAAVYNNNSSDVWVYGCDHAKVSGANTATPQHVKQTSGSTAARPTTGLVAGFSQHFDTTLGKPIWWSGSVWKDATGATV